MAASTTTIHIELNGDRAEVPTGSIRSLLEHLGIDTESPGVAVAVNDHVVRRAEWDATTVGEHDRIEIISAMQGG